MSSRVLLYVIMYTLVVCTPRPPSTTTTLRLTAQRNDTGTWTAKFGDYQMIIEHKHFNKDPLKEDQDGTWTLKVRHTSTVYEAEDADKQMVMDILQHYNNTSTTMQPSNNQYAHLSSNNEYGQVDQMSSNNEDEVDQLPSNNQYGHADQLPSNNQYGHEDQLPSNNQYGHEDQLPSNNQYGHEDQLPSNNQYGHEDQLPSNNQYGHEDQLPSNNQYGHKDQLPSNNQYGHADQLPSNNQYGHEDQLPSNNQYGHEDQLPSNNQYGHEDQLPSNNQYGHEDQLPSNNQYGHEDQLNSNNQYGHVDKLSTNNEYERMDYLTNNNEYGQVDQLSSNNETRNEESAEEQLTNEEREQFLAEEERQLIMDRYPRSRSLGSDVREFDLETRGYRYYPEVGWVKLNTAHWQWDQARKSCEADGGHLVIPDTLQKIKAFTRILKNNVDIIERAVLKNQVFVGVYVPYNNRRFITVKGEPFIPESVSIWFPNEPNDADPGEDCVTLHLEGKLRDVPCYYNLPFLCQIL